MAALTVTGRDAVPTSTAPGPGTRHAARRAPVAPKARLLLIYRTNSARWAVIGAVQIDTDVMRDLFVELANLVLRVDFKKAPNQIRYLVCDMHD